MMLRNGAGTLPCIDAAKEIRTMRRKATVAAGCIALCISIPAFAADDTCRGKWLIDDYLKSIAEWDARLPGVPPGEAEFLDKEHAAIYDYRLSSAEKQSRFLLLTKHPYYYTYELHKSFAKLTSGIQKAMAEPKPQNRMAGAASAMVDAEIAQSDLMHYVDAHPGPDTPPVFRSKPMMALIINLSYYIGCEAQTIP